MAEVAAALGLISAIITIIGTIEKIYDTARDAQSLPLAFREVNQRLPLVQSTLRIAESQLRSNGSKGTDAAISKTLEETRVKLEKLREILDRCVPPADASPFERYVAALRTLGKDHKVETLMTAVLERVQDLANHHAVKGATREQIDRLQEAIEAMSKSPPSAPDDLIEAPSAIMNVHSGSGDIYSAEGTATQNNLKDNARQFNATNMTISG
ncbi:hypothetical protein F5X68DRAFT_3637 [Plectosphaerella plurivora]|uniref:NACHT-NTPase and P-loop NTPases N-terminal domain-containing protein n=1 Tax=Plectosphaerella plurivora TaxID=936078 RepID=A0A9P8VNP7_9PEZI|nr:hypothetical protein F5X68DRAFT_3637 [Plectosphaerella plurivora]